jgi:hypothetical protein
MSGEEAHPHAKLPSSKDELAKLFGLENLRVGRHFLRDADRARIGSVWVESFWFAEILPAFHEPTVLCVVRARGETFRNNTTPNWQRAAYASTSHSAVSDIVDDPVATTLSNFDLFFPGGNLSLDGIGYKLSFQTLALLGFFYFGNPTAPRLVRLESALNLVAAEVARRSSVKELIAAVRTWDEYAAHRQSRAK